MDLSAGISLGLGRFVVGTGGGSAIPDGALTADGTATLLTADDGVTVLLGD